LLQALAGESDSQGQVLKDRDVAVVSPFYWQGHKIKKLVATEDMKEIRSSPKSGDKA